MRTYYCIGIKGTGVASLAVLLSEMGDQVGGCDVETAFSTDKLLTAHSIHVDTGFSPGLLPSVCDGVIYSTAYDERLPILVEARKRGFQVLSYNDFLAQLTKERDSYIVAGSHGKTTVTAMASFLLSRPARKEYPFFSIFGSNLQGEEKSPYQGSRFFLLEGCEYRDHFLSYQCRGALITSIDWDHPDYFPDEKSYYESYEKFVERIEKGGFLVLCVDGKWTAKLEKYVQRNRSDLNLLSYGFSASGAFRIQHSMLDGFHLPCLMEEFPLCSWSEQWTADMVGASLLATAMLLDSPEAKLYLPQDLLVTDEVFPTVFSGMLKDCSGYPGTVGRMEVVAERNGVTYIDDYAHHPTQISMVLHALRRRYPARHLLVLFSPHTASRTHALFSSFVSSLSLADKVIIQETYASARGDRDSGEDGSVALASALEKTMFLNPHGTLSAVIHAPDDEQAIKIASSWLMDGDICVTMGAGNNRFLTQRIIAQRTQRT